MSEIEKKLNMYEFPKKEMRCKACILLSAAQKQGQNIQKLQIVFDQRGSVSLLKGQ